MKINDIIVEAGILSTIGQGIGRGLAGAATGAVRMLDKAGGGDGTNVGTVAQRAAYTNKMKQTQNAKARAKTNLPAAAFAEFNNALKQNNINLQNPQSFDPASITNYLKSFAENYFAVGDEYHNKNQQEAIEAGVRQELNQMPLPTTINNISVQDYLEKANTVRTSIINQVDKMMVSQKTSSPSDRMQAVMANQPDAVLKNALNRLSQQTNPTPEVQAAITEIETELVRRGLSRNQQPAPAPAPVASQQPAAALPADVTVVSSSPIVLRYRNQDFALTDSDRWVRFGSNKLASPEMEAYLTRQLEKL